jgi:hypothetical protein
MLTEAQVNDNSPLTFLEAPQDKPSFDDWLATARAGEKFCYFEGFLADRVEPPSPEQKAEGLAALQAYGEGKVELAQRRIKPSVGGAPGSFQYLAIKRKHIEPPTVLGNPWLTRIKKHQCSV